MLDDQSSTAKRLEETPMAIDIGAAPGSPTRPSAPRLRVYASRHWAFSIFYLLYSVSMKYQKEDNDYIITIDKGENVIESITNFCIEHNIDNAYFRGIGAVEFASCGYYALEEKKYYFTKYDELIEVASATGNVMLKDGKPFVHLHAVFTDTTNNAFGGHVEEMRVGVTFEIILTPLSSKIERKHDECIGLFLIDPKEK